MAVAGIPSTLLLSWLGELARQFAAVNPISSPFASMLLLRVLRIFAIGENARE